MIGPHGGPRLRNRRWPSWRRRWRMSGRAGRIWAMPSRETKRQTAFRRLLIHLALIALSVPALMPMLWMVSTSLKADSQIYPAEGQSLSAMSLVNLIPHPVRWQNYPLALEAIPIITYLRNTLWLCLFNVIGTLLSSSIVAYGFARLEFRGKNALFLLMISTLALPGQVTMIPVFVLFRFLGWYGTYLPLIVPSFFGNPLYIFLLTQFYKTLPEDLS